MSATSTRPFKFAPIQLTDNTDLACEDEQIVKNLGSITCELKRFVGQARGYAPQAYTAPKSKTIHEQTKSQCGAGLVRCRGRAGFISLRIHVAPARFGLTRAEAKLAHTAALGDEVYSPAPQTGRVGVPIDITPFARFRFDYRSLDMLQLDGVAPSEPAPAAAAAGPSGAQPKPQIKAEPTSRKRPSEADTKPDIGAKKKRVVIEVRCELECALTRQIDSD